MMSLEEKHLALETELIVAKDAIWGLTERVINLETEIKDLKAIIKMGGNEIQARPLAQQNSNSFNSKQRARNSIAKRKRGRPLRRKIEETQENESAVEEPVIVKVEGSISESANEGSDCDYHPTTVHVSSLVNDTRNTDTQDSQPLHDDEVRKKGNPTGKNQMGIESKKSVGDTDASDSDLESPSTQKRHKKEAELKKGDPDPIWLHWKRISAESQKRVVVQCVYCSSHDQLNHATKCKRHTGVCKWAPEHVRSEFSQWKDYGKGMRRKPKSEPEPT